MPSHIVMVQASAEPIPFLPEKYLHLYSTEEYYALLWTLAGQATCTTLDYLIANCQGRDDELVNVCRYELHRRRQMEGEPLSRQCPLASYLVAQGVDLTEEELSGEEE